MNNEKWIEEIKILCTETGEFIRSHFNKLTDTDIHAKETNSLVSFVDREAEKQITYRLAKLIPEAGFLTEEDSVVNRKGHLQWIVDPLDGTTNFITGIPHFSISIALTENDNTVLAVVYNIMQDDLYHALPGEGSFVNDSPISVSKVDRLNESIIATGFPYDKSRIDPQVIKELNHYVLNARAVRRLGSAALDLCFVAQGTFQLYYERFLNAWDIAAGALIVQEAGGLITDFSGGQDIQKNGEVIACCPGLQSEMKWLIKPG